MNGKSWAAVIIATAIIVVVVAGFFVLSDDDDGGDDGVRERMVGDHFSVLVNYTETDDDGDVIFRNNFTYTYTLVSILDGNYTYLYEDSYGNTSYESWNETEIQYYTFVGTGTKDVPLYGEMEVDIYENETEERSTVAWTYPGTTTWVYLVDTYDGYEYEFLLTEMSEMEGDEPEFGHGAADTDLALGDYIIVMSETWIGTANHALVVQSVDDDGTVTYWDDYTWSYVECTAEDFFRLGQSVDDGTVVGTGLVYSYYGERLCDIYRVDNADGTVTYVYVGQDDGIGYMYEVYEDGEVTRTVTLEFSNKIAGDRTVSGDDPTDRQAGDYELYHHAYTDSEGYTDRELYAMQIDNTLDGVAIPLYYQYMGPFGWTHVQNHLYALYPRGDEVGSETLHTAYGDIECAILYYDAGNGADETYWVYEGLVMKAIFNNADGSQDRYEMILSSALGGDGYGAVQTNTGEISVGDWFTFAVYSGQDDGFGLDVYECVAAVDGDTATLDVYLWDSSQTGYEYIGQVQRSVYSLLHGFEEDAEAEYAGQSVWDNYNHDVVCDVYHLEGQTFDILEYIGIDLDHEDISALYYIGAEDGVHYGIYLWTYVDGEVHWYIMDLYASSTTY